MTRSLVRIAFSVVAVAAVVVAQQLPAEAAGRAPATIDDQAVVQLTRTGVERGQGGLRLHLTSKDTVVAGNLALATTSCDGCHATAISFQVVVADKAPTSLQVRNLAIADNTGCAQCEADAFAYQFVLAFDGNARITGAGRRQLDQIDAALGRLAKSGRSADELQGAVAAYADQVLGLLSSELRVRPVVRKAVTKKHGPSSVTRPPDALAS
jgi:hypothetical protein